jgi:hypothetical protein
MGEVGSVNPVLPPLILRRIFHRRTEDPTTSFVLWTTSKWPARHEPYEWKRALVGVNRDEQQIEVGSRPKGGRPNGRVEATSLADALSTSGSALDLDGQGRGTSTAMENKVNPLIVNQTGRDIELEAASEDAGRRDKMLNGFSLTR